MDLLLSSIVVIFALIVAHHQVICDSCEPDWIPYKDEKCFRVWDRTLMSFEEAIHRCKQGPDGGLGRSILFEDEKINDDENPLNLIVNLLVPYTTTEDTSQDDDDNDDDTDTDNKKENSDDNNDNNNNNNNNNMVKATLVNIKSEEEQQFLEEYLFNQLDSVNSFWTGAYFQNGHYRWLSGNSLINGSTYSNWVSSRPQKRQEGYCVELAYDKTYRGLWVDEPCTKKNLVVCEMPYQWSSEKIQNQLIEQRSKERNMEQQIDQIEGILQDFKAMKKDNRSVSVETNNTGTTSFEGENLLNVPIGFTYVQLSDQKSPTDLWPSTSWKDVTNTTINNQSLVQDMWIRVWTRIR